MYLYILNCEGNTLYTGIAGDIKKRVYAHYRKLPAAAKYTKSHPVTGLAALWEFSDPTAARKLEPAIKGLPRERKLRLIAAPEAIAEFFPDIDIGEFAVIRDIKFEDCIE